MRAGRGLSFSFFGGGLSFLVFLIFLSQGPRISYFTGQVGR